MGVEEIWLGAESPPGMIKKLRHPGQLPEYAAVFNTQEEQRRQLFHCLFVISVT